MKLTDKTGLIVGVLQVRDEDEVMLISDRGKIIRMKAKDIPIIGRVTQGVRLIGLEEGERVTSICRVMENGD